jgi:hypothetical protein
VRIASTECPDSPASARQLRRNGAGRGSGGLEACRSHVRTNTTAPLAQARLMLRCFAKRWMTSI